MILMLTYGYPCMEFLFEARYVNIDQLYDEFSIKKPVDFICMTYN